jgi:hypothetical protein
VLVPGVQPNAGAVATLIRSEGGRGRPEQREERRRQPAKSEADPIFSKPYEPGSAPQQKAAQPASGEPAQGKRRRPQVAALLGGLKRA